ncbi:E3 ubiquitin-protein ligase TRIM45-like [Glandiceps talaboti]
MSSDPESEEIDVDPFYCLYCKDIYKDPTLLPCLCTVCQSCIPKFGGKKGVLVCPVCREKTQIPAAGFDVLPRNVLIEREVATTGSETGEHTCKNCDDHEVVISWCLDCLQFFCQRCHDAHDRVAVCKDHVTVKIEELEKTDIKLLEKYKRMVVCKKHQLEADRLCRKCNSVVCKECTVIDHSIDKDHDVVILEVASHHYRDMIGQLHQLVEKRSKMLKGRKKHVEAEEESLVVENENANTSLYGYYTKLEQGIEDHRERMRNKLDAAYNVREKEIGAKKKEAKKTMLHIQRAIQISNEILEGGDDKELLNMMGFVAGRMESLCNEKPGNGGRGDVATDQSIRYVKDGSKMKAFTDMTSQIGEVKMSTAIPPSLIEPAEEADDFDAIICGIPSAISIMSFGGEQLLAKFSPYQFKAEIHDPGDILIPCSVSSAKSGTFLCKFRPQVPGEHSINVKLNGHSIKGSPLSFTVHPNNTLDDTKDAGGEDLALVKPIGIAVDRRGDIYVTDQKDQNNSRVVIYDVGLQYQREFQLPFGNAYDITFDQKGHLLISEHNTNTVRTYTTTGKELNKIDHREMKKPCGVTVDRKENILVADSEVKCIFVFTGRGKLLQKIGEPGKEQGRIQEPKFIAVDPNKTSNIYVSDSENDKVVTYNRKGVCGGEITASGHGRGKVTKPSGVARDRHGNILICGGFNKVMIYTATGGFVASIDSDDEPLANPHGLATTDDGFVFVVDTDNKCIKKYRYF